MPLLAAKIKVLLSESITQRKEEVIKIGLKIFSIVACAKNMDMLRTVKTITVDCCWLAGGR